METTKPNYCKFTMSIKAQLGILTCKRDCYWRGHVKALKKGNTKYAEECLNAYHDAVKEIDSLKKELEQQIKQHS